MDAKELAPSVDAPDFKDAEELVPDSMEAAAEDSLLPEDSMEALRSSILPDAMQIKSEELWPNSMDAHAQEPAPDSEMVPDSLPPGSFVCARCHLIHADREAWNRAHSKFWPCSRCGLVHEEYRISAMVYGLDEFDCSVFIPDLDELEMDGKTIVLPARVLKMLDEMRTGELDAGNVALTQEVSP